MFLPSIIEKSGTTSKAYDLPTKLLDDRIIYLCGPVTEELSASVIMQLLWLNTDNPEKPINLYINSPGGSVYQGLAIKDIMHKISAKVNTVGIGLCASMGAYLLSAGTGERKVTSSCRYMIHSVSSGHKGTIHDLEVDYNETRYLHDKLMEDIQSFTKGKSDLDLIKSMSQRDCYLSGQEALKYGFIDKVI